MEKLFNKKVLLIAPRFFGYEKEIENELIRRGAKVDFLPDRPFNSPFVRGVTRVRREWILPFADRFFLRSIEDFGRGHYDVIFVVVGEGLSVQLLSQLRSTFPRASFVLYMWDALRNRRLLDRNLPLFDACYTFDASDVKRYAMKFRPLFFAPGFERGVNLDYRYHLSFVGTAHSDRFRVASNVRAALPANMSTYFYLFLQAPWIYYAHKLGNGAFRTAKKENFNFVPLTKKSVQDVFFESMCVLDIEHPKQTGLTMRTFETLGASKKLITTNLHVKDMDFYRPENILVIDRNNTSALPDEFFQMPYTPLQPGIYTKYSLSAWLNEVLL